MKKIIILVILIILISCGTEGVDPNIDFTESILTQLENFPGGDESLLSGKWLKTTTEGVDLWEFSLKNFTITEIYGSGMEFTNVITGDFTYKEGEYFYIRKEYSLEGCTMMHSSNRIYPSPFIKSNQNYYRFSFNSYAQDEWLTLEEMITMGSSCYIEKTKIHNGIITSFSSNIGQFYETNFFVSGKEYIYYSNNGVEIYYNQILERTN